MVRLIVIENPFEPRVHKLEELVCTNMPVTNYTALQDRDVFINGRPATELSIPADGDDIISMPHIEGGGVGKILGFVAMVALTVFTSGIAAMVLLAFLELPSRAVLLLAVLQQAL